MDRRGGRASMVVALVALAAPASVAAQTVAEVVREEARAILRADDFGAQLQGLAGFAALPGIAAATLTADGAAGDVDITRVILPLRHRFHDVPVLGAVPYVEGTLGYSRSEQTLRLGQGTALETVVDSDVWTLTAIGGLGLDVTILPGTTVRPILLGGYAYVADKGGLSGPGAPVLRPALRGLVTDFHANELLYGAALELEHQRGLGRDLQLVGSVRYNHLWGSTLSASDDGLEDDGTFGVLTAAVTLDGPTGATAFGRELRWLAFATNSTFPGLTGEALGFDYFFELGGGLELVDRAVVEGVEGLSLRASAILGDGVRGFSIGAQIEF